MRQIAVLGNGVTAKAVKAFLASHSGFEEVAAETAELIVTSPGIPPYGWPKTSVEIISDIEFAYRILKEKGINPTIIGVTGTNGKTTVASGIAHLLDVTAYGNIGRPLIEDIGLITSHSIIVLELSSYQLYSSSLLTCNIAIITNVSEDHLEWHQSFEHYEKAKLSILKSAEQVAMVPKSIADKVRIAHKKCIYIDDLKPMKAWFLEPYNCKNMAVIEQAGHLLGVSEQKISEKLSTFKLPPFRCQPLATPLATVVNDSKSTNMGSTLAAVNSYKPIDALILAGQAKGKFSLDWATEIIAYCKTVYASGGLAQQKDLFPEPLKSSIIWCENLKQTTHLALKNHSGGTILFSPGAASFDEFENYIDRGKAFNQYVTEYQSS